MQYGEPGVFVSFEETDAELKKNVRSLGFDLDCLIAEKKLRLDYVRVERSEIEETGEYDLEGLFVRLGYAIDSIGAKRVVLDTIETLFSALKDHAVLRAELRRLFRWLKDKGMDELARFNRAMVDRELRMIELKKEVNALCARLGEPVRYRVDFTEETP
jgi:circadian clock protein KaiC